MLVRRVPAHRNQITADFLSHSSLFFRLVLDLIGPKYFIEDIIDLDNYIRTSTTDKVHQNMSDLTDFCKI